MIHSLSTSDQQDWSDPSSVLTPKDWHVPSTVGDLFDSVLPTLEHSENERICNCADCLRKLEVTVIDKRSREEEGIDLSQFMPTKVKRRKRHQHTVEHTRPTVKDEQQKPALKVEMVNVSFSPPVPPVAAPSEDPCKHLFNTLEESMENQPRDEHWRDETVINLE
jgi:hypothetical protein